MTDPAAVHPAGGAAKVETGPLLRYHTSRTSPAMNWSGNLLLPALLSNPNVVTGAGASTVDGLLGETKMPLIVSGHEACGNPDPVRVRIPNPLGWMTHVTVMAGAADAVDASAALQSAATAKLMSVRRIEPLVPAWFGPDCVRP